MEILMITIRLMAMSLIGFIARKAGIVDAESTRSISRLVIDITIPCYVFVAVSGIGDIRRLISGNIAAIPAAFALMLLLFIIGEISNRIIGGPIGRVVRFATLFSNALVYGMQITEAYWGSDGLLFLLTMYIPIRFAYYGLSECLLSPGKQSSAAAWKAALKTLYSPAVVAYALALVFLLAEYQLPDVVLTTLNSVGSCMTPLGMMLIGIIAASYDFKEVFSARVFLISLYKLILLPALILLLVKLTPLTGMPAGMIVLYAALPSGTLITSFCLKYDPDERARLTSAGVVLMTSVGCVLTVPLWLMLMEKILF